VSMHKRIHASLDCSLQPNVRPGMTGGSRNKKLVQESKKLSSF
jgi:hypothetical protein